MDEIADWRRRIDAIDDRLVSLFNERASYAIRIGEIKQKSGLDVHNPERERAILDRIIRLGMGPLDNAALERIFTTLIEECRKREDEPH